MNPLYFLVLALNLTVSTIGDALAKFSSVTNNNNWFYIGLVFNIVAITTFMLLIRMGGLAVSTSVTLLLTILCNVLVGIFVFHENIDTFQLVGIWMGVLAIILISNAYKSFI